MAFAGIGLSPDATGEFLFSLFAVIGISLLLSWVLAITVTPMLGHYFFKQGKEGEVDAYSGILFRIYGSVLRGALRFRWLVVVGLAAVTVVCYAGFGLMKQQFFPDSNTPLFFVHYKLPQGTTIARTAEDMAVFEEWLNERDDVVSVTTFVGQGATRFMLTYAAEDPNPSYGHMIIRTETLDDIPACRPILRRLVRCSFLKASSAPGGWSLGPAAAIRSRRGSRAAIRKYCGDWPMRRSSAWPPPRRTRCMSITTGARRNWRCSQSMRPNAPRPLACPAKILPPRCNSRPMGSPAGSCASVTA